MRVTTKPATGYSGRYVNRLDPADNPMVWARAGETALIPIEPTPAQIREGQVEVRLDRGDTQIVPLFELLCEPAPISGDARGARPTLELWLADAIEGASDGLPSASPPPSAQGGDRSGADTNAVSSARVTEWRWRTRPAPEAARVSADAVYSRGWFVRVDMPRDAAGQGMWLGARRAPVGWLLDPPYQPPAPGSDVAFWEAHHAELLGQLRPALESPLHRWRARLALEIASVPGVREIGRFDDPLVERLAEQIEAEWTIALRYLSASDATLAERVRRRLAGVVIIAPGGGTLSKADRLAVVWPASDDELEQLKRLLLSSGRSTAQRTGSGPPRDSARTASDQPDGGRAERARTWLDSQPSLGAWIIDDAGSIDAMSDRLIATLGCVRLPGSIGTDVSAGRTTGFAAVSAEAPAAALAPTVGTIAAGQLVTLAVPTPDRVRSGASALEGGADASARRSGRSPGASASDRTLRVSIADWRAERALLPDASPVRPPGLVVGPFCHDWSMDSWWRHVSDPKGLDLEVDVDQATAAMLMYEPEPRGAVPSSGSDWVLYVECRDRESRLHGAEYVRVMFGPLNTPLGSARVFRDGSVERDGRGGGGGGGLGAGDGDAVFAGVRSGVRVQEWGGRGGMGARSGSRPDGADEGGDSADAGAAAPRGSEGSIGRVRSGGASGTGASDGDAARTAQANSAAASRGSDASADTPLHPGSSGWSVWIRVPRACIEPSLAGVAGQGTLRFGVERFAGDGLRSAWPRPLTFWQSQPGRVRVDLDQWSEK